MRQHMASMTNESKQFLAAREAVEVAKQALAQAEAALKESLARNGVTSTVIDGKKITLVKSEREKYDAKVLPNLIDWDLYDKVTEVVVDSKKFRAAVELGEITPEVKDAVTTVTYVEALRVTEIGAAAATSHSSALVA